MLFRYISGFEVPACLQIDDPLVWQCSLACFPPVGQNGFGGLLKSSYQIHVSRTRGTSAIDFGLECDPRLVVMTLTSSMLIFVIQGP